MLFYVNVQDKTKYTYKTDAIMKDPGLSGKGDSIKENKI